MTPGLLRHRSSARCKIRPYPTKKTLKVQSPGSFFDMRTPGSFSILGEGSGLGRPSWQRLDRPAYRHREPGRKPDLGTQLKRPLVPLTDIADEGTRTPGVRDVVRLSTLTWKLANDKGSALMRVCEAEAYHLHAQCGMRELRCARFPRPALSSRQLTLLLRKRSHPQDLDCTYSPIGQIQPGLLACRIDCSEEGPTRAPTLRNQTKGQV